MLVKGVHGNHVLTFYSFELMPLHSFILFFLLRHLIPTPEYTVLLNAQETLFWSNIQDNLDRLIKNLATQMLNFTTLMSRSKTYLDAYVAGNELTNTFYE